MTILITGAKGFVGSTLCSTLQATSYKVRQSNQRLSEVDWSQSLAVDEISYLIAHPVV